MRQAIVLFTPIPTREYGEPDAVGPFADATLAQDYLDHAEVGEGWEARIIELDPVE